MGREGESDTEREWARREIDKERWGFFTIIQNGNLILWN